MVVSSLGTARLIGIGAACAASVAVGLGLVFKLVTPESVARLGTPELLGLLGLIVLLALVVAAIRAARSSAPAAISVPAEPDSLPIVVLAPDVRDRTGRRHRRRTVRVQHTIPS